MAKNTVHQIEAIGANLERLAGKDAAQQVMQGSEAITGSTKPEKVAAWVQAAMERLDRLVDAQTRNEVMLNCGYNCALANAAPLKKAIARRNKHTSEAEFLEAELVNPPPGTRLERQGEILYQFYTPRLFTHPMRCYCSLFRALPGDETASLTYCQCSRGFVQKYWEGILGRQVRVEILESSISGAEECKFAIYL